ncbi:MAG: DUF2330 domain-containing protein [Myxococcota bacterium]
MPQPAQACGGTFCDAGPQSMPVDQSGENILFVRDGEDVEVHIQIRYDGEAENFAWVIPLTAVPSFSIGSDALFSNLLTGTVPSYGFNSTRETCTDSRFDGGAQDDPSNGAGITSGAADSGGDGEDDGGPTIVLKETVGAFDIVVLEGGTADEVVAWLDENGYQQDPEATPILEEYLAEGHLFGAIKLTGGADVDQIHPITLRYTGTELCVPLRLTRIAAVEDMDVRTFFLSDARMVPTNYRHVLVNPLKIDWLNFGANYKEVITAAVDAEHANGRAFVTEFAGPSNTVSSAGLYVAAWAPDDFRGATPGQLPGILESQSLAFCNEWDGCQLNHPLVGGVLGEFLQLPDGVSVEQFIDCPECYTEGENAVAFDSEGFADAFDERIVGPGQHAEDLLQTHDYVTRLYTTISPHEMTEDPIFHAREDLDEVPNMRIADRRIRCSGDSVFNLPDGRQVFVPNGRDWPEFPAEMPWEEEVSEIPMAGAPMTLANNTEQIDAMLEAYNADAGFNADGCGGCQIESKPSSEGRWAMGMAIVLIGAGLTLRRRRAATTL